MPTGHGVKHGGHRTGEACGGKGSSTSWAWLHDFLLGALVRLSVNQVLERVLVWSVSHQQSSGMTLPTLTFLFVATHFCFLWSALLLFVCVGLWGSGWTRLSLCSTATSMESWDSFLRRWRVVFAPWSIQAAREPYPASSARPHYPALPVLRTMQPDVEPVTTATSSTWVPAGPALPHLWTTTWTWTWISLMLRSSKQHFFCTY